MHAKLDPANGSKTRRSISERRRRDSRALAYFRPTIAAALVIMVSGCGPARRETMIPIGTNDEARLARTAAIVRESTAARPGVLKIMFYGQSITSTQWTDLAAAHLRRAYPSVRFVVRNMAIPGNDSTLLERAAARDLDEFYPDLVVFHVYGDHRAYERIIRLIRERTAAEVIVQTDHVRFPIEPICKGGLRLSIALPAGCSGSIWLRQHVWDDFMSGTFIPRIATTYALAVDPRRRGWNAYLAAHDLAPAALLRDGLHPNPRGWRLAAVLFDRYFDGVVARWNRQPQQLVRALKPPSDGISDYQLIGNRVELIADAPLAGDIAATIDGHGPREIDGCWQTSRATTIPAMPQWPAVRRITIDRTYRHADRWTATLTGFDATQKAFAFKVVSERAGADGDGRGEDDFVSPSGRVRIEAQDWALGYSAATTHERVPEAFSVRWRQGFVCGDLPRTALGAGTFEYRYLVATGLSNGPHRLRLSVKAEAAAHIRELRVYRPPLGV